MHSLSTTSGTSLLGSIVYSVIRGDIKAYRWLFALCTLAIVAPLWAADVFPFQDYAGNMSYAAILAGSAQQGSLIGQTYEVGGLFLPNGLLFWTWSLLGPGLGFVLAGKLLLTLYAIALPLSVDRLLVAAGRERRFALLAFPFVYNYNLMMGFASYATAIPVALYTLTWAYRLLDAPSRPRAFIVACLSYLTFLAHAQGYLVLGLMAMAFVCFVPRTWRDFVMCSAAFGASLIPFFPWFLDEFLMPPESTALGGAPLIPAFQDPGELFARLGEYSFVKWDKAFDGWVFIATLSFFVLGMLDRRVDGAREGRARYGIEAMTACVFIAYLATPEHTTVQAAIGSRLVVFCMLLGLGWLSMPRWKHAPGIILCAMSALSLVYASYVSAEVSRFERQEVGDNFLPMIDALPDETRLAVIIHHRNSKVVDVHAHEHMYGYHFALNRGIAYSTFHSYYGRHARWLPDKTIPYPGRQVKAFLRSANACHFDYLLTRTQKIPRWKRMKERLSYVDHSARYSLWKIEKERIPLCSKEGKEAPARAKVAADRSALTGRKARTIASTLSPKVGRARGRTLGGKWKQHSPSGAPLKRERRKSERDERREDKRPTLTPPEPQL